MKRGLVVAAVVLLIAWLLHEAQRDSAGPPASATPDQPAAPATELASRPRTRATSPDAVPPSVASAAPTAPFDGTMKVRVATEDGTPSPKAYVEVKGDGFAPRWAYADENGVATIKDVPNRPVVIVQVDGTARMLRRPRDVDIAGERRTVRVRVLADPADAAGKLVRDLLPTWSAFPYNVERSLKRGADGLWSLDVPPVPGRVTLGGGLDDDPWVIGRDELVMPGGLPVELRLVRRGTVECDVSWPELGGAGEPARFVRFVALIERDAPQGAEPRVVKWSPRGEMRKVGRVWVQMIAAGGPTRRSSPLPMGSRWMLVASCARGGSDASQGWAVVPEVVVPTEGLKVVATSSRTVRGRIDRAPERLPDGGARSGTVLAWPEGACPEVALPRGFDPEGRFVVQAPREAVVISIGIDGEQLWSPSPVVVGTDDQDVVVHVESMPPLSGRLEFEDGEAVGMGRVRVGPLEARVTPDGSFTFDHVLPGRRRLTWEWMNEVSIDLGFMDVPASADVVLKLRVP